MVKEDSKLSSGTSNEDINYKHVVNRIDRIQKHCGELAKVLAGYAKKSTIIRDKNDEIAKCLAKYTKVEDQNTSSKLAMTVCSELLAKVGDHQTIAIQRLETKVLPNFSSYGRICKCVKADVRNATAASARVISRRKMATAFSERMDETKYRNVITDAERDLENAMAESSRLGVLSQEQVIKFEHKRLIDLKETLQSFFKIEIARHAKSLELLTEAYKYIHSIDEEADLEVLKGGLKLREIQPIKPLRENKLKSPKNSKTIESNSDETDEEDSWNSDLVQKLGEMIDSQPRRSTTKITKKNSSAHIDRRNEPSRNPKQTSNNKPNLCEKNPNFQRKDDTLRKEKAKIGESFKNRESLIELEASRVASDSLIPYIKDSYQNERKYRRAETAPFSKPDKYLERISSATTVSNENDKRRHEKTLENKELRQYQEEEALITGISGKKVSFRKDSQQGQDKFDRNHKGKFKNDELNSKKHSESNFGRKSTTSTKSEHKQFL